MRFYKKEENTSNGEIFGGFLHPPQTCRDSLARLKPRYVQIALVIGQQKDHEDLSRAINGIMKKQRGGNKKVPFQFPFHLNQKISAPSPPGHHVKPSVTIFKKGAENGSDNHTEFLKI